MADVDTRTAIAPLPCLDCGRWLPDHGRVEHGLNAVRCACGIAYTTELLDRCRHDPHPWYRMLACACGQVRRDGDTITVTVHRCAVGTIGDPPPTMGPS